jgi:hypothetical protein
MSSFPYSIYLKFALYVQILETLDGVINELIKLEAQLNLMKIISF